MSHPPSPPYQPSQGADQLAGRQFKIRVAVVLCHQGHLLLMRQNGKPFWVLPGGTLEFGESLETCGIRELQEEVGIEIEMDRLLYVSEFRVPDTRHVVDFFFLGRWVVDGSTPLPEFTPPFPENIDAIRWVPLTEAFEFLGQELLQPAGPLGKILEDCQHDFPIPPNPYLSAPSFIRP